jgi:hypothetical protein
MGGLIRSLAALFAYFCVATLITQVSVLAYFRATGQLDDKKLTSMANVLKGIDPAPRPEQADKQPREPELEEQPSLEDHETQNDLAARNLELREQAVKSALDRVFYEKNAMTEEKDRYELVKRTFEDQLAVLREGALSSGRESVRMIWENIKPKQAKEQILKMLDDGELNEVVTILTAMPIAKRAKIVGEFKSTDEAEKLDEILSQILAGAPEVDLIDDTTNQVKPQTASATPRR